MLFIVYDIMLLIEMVYITNINSDTCGFIEREILDRSILLDLVVNQNENDFHVLHNFYFILFIYHFYIPGTKNLGAYIVIYLSV